MRRLLVAALVCGLLAPAAATAKEPIGGMKSSSRRRRSA
jgi:hypothetical protein